VYNTLDELELSEEVEKSLGFRKVAFTVHTDYEHVLLCAINLLLLAPVARDLELGFERRQDGLRQAGQVSAL